MHYKDISSNITILKYIDTEFFFSKYTFHISYFCTFSLSVFFVSVIMAMSIVNV